MSEPTGTEWRVGAVLDRRYEIVEELGRGGMGVVHRVRHLEWGTDLAVKSPLADLVRVDRLRAQFVAEAETWVSLGLHPHVCACHYVRTVDGVPRVFAEYVSGGSLLEWVDDDAGSGRRLYAGGPVEALARVLDVAIQVAWGLEHAHRHGVVHRDVKPANVLMDADGTAKLTDFGLSRVRDLRLQAAPDAAPGASLLGPGGGGLTPAYASPEQAAGQPVGRRGDVYSFAVLVLELFAGGVFWRTGPAAGEALRLLRSDPAAAAGLAADDPGLPTLPAAVADLLKRCLREDPAARPASMAEVAAELVTAYRESTGQLYQRPEPVTVDLRADGLNNRALSLLDLGLTQEADAAFAEAAAADPRHLAVAYNAGLRQWRRGEVTDEDLLKNLEGIRDGADSQQAGYLLAQVHRERGDMPFVAMPGIDWQAASYVAPPLRIAADAQLAITGDRDGFVHVWDLETGECRTSIRAEGRVPVHAVDITADGRYGASVGENVRLWDLKTGCSLGEFTYRERGVASPLHVPPLYHGTVRISSDARVVLFALDGKAEIWDAFGHRELYDAGSGSGAAIDMNADGFRAVFAVGGELRVWELARGHSWVCPPTPGGLGPGTVQLSRNAQFAVTSGWLNGRIHVWDLVMRRGRLLKGHRGGAWALSVSKYGDHVLSAGSDGTLRYWDRDGRCLHTVSGFEDAGIVAASRLDPDRELDGNADDGPQLGGAGQDRLQALTISHDGAVRRWTLPADSDPAANGITPRAQPWLSRPRPHADLTDLNARADALLGEAVSALAAGRLAQARDLLGLARALAGHERDPRLLAAWRELARHTTRTGLRASWPGTVLAEGWIEAADLSADGRIAAVAGQYGPILVQNVEENTALRNFSMARRDHEPVLLSLSADGSRLLVAVPDRTLLYSVQTGECLATVAEGRRSLRSVRFAADANHALISGYGGRTEHWDLRDGTLLAEYDMQVDSVAWAGPVPLGAVADGLVHAVEVKALDTGRIVLRLDAAGPPPEPAELGQEGFFFDLLRDMKRRRVEWTAVALNADGTLLLTGNEHSDLQLWEVTTGERLRTFDAAPGHVPSRISFTGDGRFAMTSGRDFKIRAWDVGTGACLQVVGEHRHPVEGIVLAADSRRLLSWSMPEAARLWELDWDLAPGNRIGPR